MHQQNKPFETTASTMVVDSGATLHFMQPEENIPNTGPSEKVVVLPNGDVIKTSHTTYLPFNSLLAKVRRADVLPMLKQNSLVSVGKLMMQVTRLFHPHGEGVTVHKAGTFKLKVVA